MPFPVVWIVFGFYIQHPGLISEANCAISGTQRCNLAFLEMPSSPALSIRLESVNAYCSFRSAWRGKTERLVPPLSGGSIAQKVLVRLLVPYKSATGVLVK